MVARERFASRWGFLLIAAGCAIGLGNVWRFPFIAGQYGGALFVFVYILFLLTVGIPLLSIELAVGRSSQSSVARSFAILQQRPQSRWSYASCLMICGNYLLMSFYCVVTGWMLYYCVRCFAGDFMALRDAQASGAAFADLLSSPWIMLASTITVIVLGFAVCALGLRRGVECITKPLMVMLLALLIFLAVRAVFMPGFASGMAYYLQPSFSFIQEHGWRGLLEVISAALAQAFFTLSIGIGCIQIFGSYISRERTLLSESLTIMLLDTAVALLSGFIIFPACFSYGVEPGQGPGLIFVTLVSIFSNMSFGYIWGGLFFIFMFFAAMSTLIAVFENIIAICMELFTIPRVYAVILNLGIVLVISLPCILGFNVWSDLNPLGGNSTILDLEDFLVSNNILPLGALCYIGFVVGRSGWGYAPYLAEVNAGHGLKMPRRAGCYYRWVLPLIIIGLFIINLL